jgi:putative FmdB family regulatory protein
MPLYEYECDANRHRFEVIQKLSDPPIDRCPTCGSSVHKLQSAPAFQFKGTGWYVTDYARKNADGSAKSEGEGKADAKGESKTDTKSDTKSDGTSAGAESSKAATTEKSSKPSTSSDSSSGPATSKS